MFGSRSSASSSLIALAALAWLFSLWLPAIAVPGVDAYRGLRVLLEGWRTLSLGIPAWCANPAFAVALVLVAWKRQRTALVFSGLSLILAVSSVAAARFAALAGTTLPDFELMSGTYVWISSTLCLFVGIACRIGGIGNASHGGPKGPDRSPGIDRH